MAEAFGLDDESYNIPLNVEPSGIGDIESEAALGQTSIGQRDVRMTAATGAAAVANDGTLMHYPVDQVRAFPTCRFSTRPIPRCSASRFWDIANQLTEMMLSVVDNGPARPRRSPASRWPARPNSGHGRGRRDHRWFIGFAAKGDDPEIAIAVFVANGQGGTVAARIAGRSSRSVLGAGLP